MCYRDDFALGRCVCLLLQDLFGTRECEEPGTLTQGAPVFPGSSRLGIEPRANLKTPGVCVLCDLVSDFVSV
jgi:hypothetical protein